jgi:hypothetical protein
VLRVLRPNKPEPELQPTVNPEKDRDGRTVEVTTPAVGLDGFASESHGGTSAANPSSQPGRSWLIAGLIALVIAEAVPAGLWARDFLAGARSPDAAPPPLAAAPTVSSTLSAVAPCEVPVPAAVTDEGSKATAPIAAAAGLPAADRQQAIAAGVVSVVTPFSLNIFNRGRLVGTSDAETIMLPLGTYDLDLVNDAVGYRARRSVTLQAGRTATLRIDPPSGVLHINALPWAEVWMDNQRLGETPIGNLQVPIGPRELVFRHPELGERRTRVLVTLKEPARVSIDLRKP